MTDQNKTTEAIFKTLFEEADEALRRIALLETIKEKAELLVNEISHHGREYEILFVVDLNYALGEYDDANQKK